MRVCMPRWTDDRLTEMYCTECSWTYQIPPDQPNWLRDEFQSQVDNAFHVHDCANHARVPQTGSFVSAAT